MGKIFNGKIAFASALQPTGAQPLDDRTVVQSFEDLLSGSTFIVNGASAAYNGMIVSVIDDKQAYMLIDKNNISDSDSWVSVGSGYVSVDTYADAVNLATDDNIGQIIYVKNQSEYDSDGEDGEGTAIKYDAAPYIVVGSGELMKLSTSTSSGDINSDIASLKTKVSNLESTVGDDESGLVKRVSDLESFNHDDYKDADEQLKLELQESIDTKVDKSVYEEKVSEINESLSLKVSQESFDEKVTELDAATEKLLTIESGAQVNKIEVIKVNGVALTTAESDKSVDITIPSAPIQGVVSKTEGQILSINGDKLDTTLVLEYVSSKDSENGVSALRLKGVDNSVISSIDASDFVKDGMIDNVVLDGPIGESGETGTKYLVITWNTDSGKDVTRLDVSDLFNPYSAENGVQLNDGKFSLKLATNEQYLIVGTDGLSITDALWNRVIELDNTNLSAATEYADSVAISAETSAKNYADEVSLSAETAAKTYADETFVKLDGFNEFTQDFEDKLEGIENGAQVNRIESISLNGVDLQSDENKHVEISIDSSSIEVGVDINDGENVVYDSTQKVSDVLQSIQNTVSSAINNSLTNVNSGDGINVTAISGNQQTISVKLSENESNFIEIDAANNGLVVLASSDDNNLIKNGTDGRIFAAMYYDGDDTE